MKRLVLAFKFGFKFLVGGSVPVLFSSMVYPENFHKFGVLPLFEIKNLL
jgi:hypothetical protein